MADNSMMGNVTQVEQYGKSLGQVQQQMREIFKKLQQQTKSIGSVWKDDQFKNFEQEFNQTIVKNINETTAKMELMSNYVKKMVEIHRQAQNQKIY
ncbi:MAG: WXG100 family type VII secretion target [Bacteroidaceae bacterium]|jgi:2-oxoglutarate dehydrogenase complex dehydrogenase (E1) component-like enzyme|nr:WXG100 family type VII secretion target [Bacteroidaceae bacterium]